jgi:hypothetical protein
VLFIIAFKVLSLILSTFKIPDSVPAIFLDDAKRIHILSVHSFVLHPDFFNKSAFRIEFIEFVIGTKLKFFSTKTEDVAPLRVTTYTENLAYY